MEPDYNNNYHNSYQSEFKPDGFDDLHLDDEVYAPEPLISITYLIFLKMRLWQYIMRHMRQANLMDFTMVTDIAYMKKRNVQLLYSYFEVI